MLAILICRTGNVQSEAEPAVEVWVGLREGLQTIVHVKDLLHDSTIEAVVDFVGMRVRNESHLRWNRFMGG